MSQVAESIHIAAPQTQVFKFCHDMKRRPEWDTRVDKIELQGLSTVLRKGALLRVDTNAGRGLAYSWEGEVTQYMMPKSSTVRVMETALVSGILSGGTEEWKFESENGGTRFTIINKYRPRGFVNRFLDGIYKRSLIRRSIRRSLRGVKELLEAH